jgi:hydroxymethylglutaryl-CoA lyase
LEQLDLFGTHSKLLAIVANVRGAEDALQFEQIDYLGFPLSLSETFQQRNTNKSIADAMDTVEEIQNLCQVKGKTQVVYLSMGFGNPYGDAYSPELVADFVHALDKMDIRIISFADTVGTADADLIRELYKVHAGAFPHIEFGMHLHTRPEQMRLKVKAALEAGCRRFDGALKGFGGCPMAKDELVGNVATEHLIDFLESEGQNLQVNKSELKEALKLAKVVFG